MKRLVIYAAAILVLGGAIALVPLLRAHARAEFRRRVERLITDLGSEDFNEVQDAVHRLADSRAILDEPRLVLELADHFSRRSLPPTDQALVTSISFWNTILGSGSPGVEELVSEALSRIRHQGLLIASRSGSLDFFYSDDEGVETNRMREFVAADLAKSFFFPPAPPKKENRETLWDRINLEELGGRVTAAMETLEHIEFRKVESHWEIMGSRDRYTLLFADLIGWLRRRVTVSGELDATTKTKLLARLEAKRLELVDAVPEGRRTLFDGIDALRRGEPEEALKSLDRFLEDQADGDAKAWLVKPFYWQLGFYSKALAHYEAASRLAGEARRIAPTREHSRLQQTRLELRLAQYFAELKFEKEYHTTIDQYFSANRSELPLLEALGKWVWGTARERTAARDRIARILEVEKEILHPDDLPWWRSVAAGRLPSASPVPTLFRVGRIYEEKGDLDRLKATIDRMEFLIENKSQQSFLHLLKALLDTRRDRIHEAVDSLSKLLDQEDLPAQIDRALIDALVREVEAIKHKKDRIREHLVEAERILREIYIQRAGLHPDVILAANSALLRLQLESPFLYAESERATPLSHRELRREILSTVDKSRRLSFFVERVWLELRDSVLELFYEHLKRDRLETALTLLELLEEIQHDSDGRQSSELKGLVYRIWATRLMDGARTTEDLEESEEMWASSARHYKAVYEQTYKPDLRRNAILAFERAGDPFGVLGLTDSGEIRTTDRDLLLAVGRALIRTGDYRRGSDTLRRLVQLLWREDLPSEEPYAPLALGNVHFTRDIPADLERWITVDPATDAINGVGAGYLSFDSAQRELRWQAPTDPRPGSGVVIENGDLVRLHSDDRRKTLRVRVKTSTEEDLVPESDGRWEIRLHRRDFPLEPAAAYLWQSLARIQIARLPIFDQSSDALNFVHAHLRPDGDVEVQAELKKLLAEVAIRAYDDPERKQLLATRLRERLTSWKRRLTIEKNLRRPGRDKRLEALMHRLNALEKLLAGLDTADGFIALLETPDQQLENSLVVTYVDLIKDWLEEHGDPALRGLEKLERRRQDAEAERVLLTLAENYGYRSPIWQGSLFLRGYQLYLQAREEERDPEVAQPVKVPFEKRSAVDLENEAREILTRLVEAPGSLSSLMWTPRGLSLLGKLRDRSSDWERAHDAYDRLANLKIGANSRDLTASDRREIQSLIDAAFLSRADASYKSGQYQRALLEYDRAAKLHVDSPRVLWAQYQLGSCYLRQGRTLDALREFQKGRSVISRFFTRDAPERHWLTGDRLSSPFEQILTSLRTDTQLAAATTADATPPGAEFQNFWIRLFDSRIQGLTGKG